MKGFLQAAKMTSLCFSLVPNVLLLLLLLLLIAATASVRHNGAP
jgi:hypothetical protein